MTLPYKKRKIDKALARPDSPQGEQPITIEIADGPAIPRTDDPGLYYAWWVLMAATPLIVLTLVCRDNIAGLFLSVWPDSAWLAEVASAENPYRNFFFFMPDGLLVTFKIVCFSIPVAVTLGIITGLCRVSRHLAVNLAASIYVEMIRGIPLLIQLYFVYYAMGRILLVPPMTTVVLTIGFCYGAYMGEVVRSGIKAIDRGQREAAMSLGFTPLQTMIYVILPQAMRTILPPMGNECIALLKDSTLVSILAVADILRRAREFASSTYAYFEAYTMVALVYLFLTLLLSKLVSKMEHRMSSYERR